MTHIEPGAGNGAGRIPGDESAGDAPGARPDVPKDPKPGTEYAAAGTAAAGSGEESHEGGGGTGTGGGAGASDRFLGVEKDFWLRILFIIAAGFVAWVSFWFIVILAAAQLIYRLASGDVNEDLRGFTRNMIRYLWELLGFVTLARDKRPFLFGGAFPSSKDEDE